MNIVYLTYRNTHLYTIIRENKGRTNLKCNSLVNCFGQLI